MRLDKLTSQLQNTLSDVRSLAVDNVNRPAKRHGAVDVLAQTDQSHACGLPIKKPSGTFNEMLTTNKSAECSVFIGGACLIN